MIQLREEGEVIKFGVNVYPASSNQVGFVLRLWGKPLFVRYNKKLRLVKVHQ